MILIKKSIVTLAFALAVNPIFAAPVVWTQYTSNPDKHPTIPNCSYAGYKYGEVSLPNPSGPIINVKDPLFGAKGDGVTDDTTAIRNAISSVGSSGGVVYFPDGTYVCSGVIFVHKNNTILRGQSRANTKIRFTRPLKTAYADNTSSTGSCMWSWAGGLIWFTPQSKNTYRSSTANFNTEWTGGLDSYRSKGEAWNVGSELTAITASRVRGDKTITVANSASLTPGRFVFIRITNTSDTSVLKHLAGDGTWAGAYSWTTSTSERILSAKKPFIDWPVEIASVSGTTVTLKQPLRFDLRTAWSPKVMAMGDTIRDSGMENMTVVLARNYDWAFSTHHLKEPGWNGPWFNNAINCFVRAVTVVDPDHGMGVAAAKNITFTDVRLDWSGASGRRDHHHATTCRVHAQDCIWENFVIASEAYHGINVEDISMGNVWSKGTMNFGTFDTHKMLPLEAIHTEITINNTGERGGSGNAGPIMGARFVNWNINVSNSRNHMVGEAELMPRGTLVGIRGCTINAPGNSQSHIEANGSIPDPANLYLAQKTLRIGAGNPAPTVSITSPADGATFTAPASITINASAADSNGTVSKVEFFSGSTLLGTDSSSPYSLVWTGVGAGQYSLSAKATDNGGASTTSGIADISVVGSGGSIAAAKSTQPASLTLSSEGSIDWSHWGLNTASDWNHKSGITAQISNVTKLGTATVNRFTDATMTASWSGGTPAASATGSTSGIYVPGVGNGFQITVPADTTERILKLYCGVWKSQGKLELFLSDGSAAAFVDTSFGSTTGSANTMYTIHYKAGSAGQKLTAKWSVQTSHDSSGGGTVGWQAATLSTGSVSNVAPTASLTSPASGSTYTAPASISLAATAGDSDGTVNKVDFLAGSTLIATDSSSPYSAAWNSVGAGMYTLSAVATDNAGATGSSSSVNVTVNSSSSSSAPTGSLTSSKTTQPTSLSLSTEGVRDWSHWGLNATTDWNHKSGITAQISNITKVGTATVSRYTDGTCANSWSGGTPTASVSSTTAGIYVTGVNNGFQITVPADTTARTLKVYCGVWKSQGKLEASLSDGSAASIVDTSHGSTTGSLNTTFNLSYKAASAGQTLTVRWTVGTSHDTNGSGTVGWQAATLQ